MRTDFVLDVESTGLIVIDMQSDQMTLYPKSALAVSYPEIARYWNHRMSETVIPNIMRLIDSFRGQNGKIVFTRNGNMTTSGAELTERLKARFPEGEPGSYRALLTGDIPVLLTRASDGELRAFLNVCSHRGSIVVPEGTGNASRFTCPYHSWAYDNRGALLGIYKKASDRSTLPASDSLRCPSRNAPV